MEKNDVFYTCYKHTWEGSKVTTEEVEAIPVEFIKSWAMKNWVKSKKCEYDIIVSKLIDDWLEEENKIDKDMPHELLSEREKRALQEAVTWVTSWLGPDAVVGISYTEEDWEKENE